MPLPASPSAPPVATGLLRSRLPVGGVVFAVRAAIALVLLAPLVILPHVLFPHAVGKALYTRTLIAVAVALWAVLAAARPGAWGPRFSVAVALLAAWLAAGAVTAPFGVSLQRSLWSDYERMQGLVDAAHWVALAVVLVAMLRTGADWRRFLNLNLGVGLVVALAAVARFHLPESALIGWWPEPRYPRISVTFGNPIALGAYMQAVALMALGFLARSYLGAPARAPARLFWAVTGGSALWALAVTGSLGAFAGVAAGTGAAAAFYGVWGPSSAARNVGRMAFGGLVAGAVVLAGAMALRGPMEPGGARGAPAFDIPLLERASNPARVGSTLSGRLDNWEAGLEAFAARPLLGWGAENYLVAASRFDETAGATNRARDHAHNVPVEEAATKGVAGLLAWLALWGFTFFVVVRAVRRAAPPEQALVVFVGAALLGWLVQSLSAFYTATSWLQHVVLLGFVAHAEIGMRARGPAVPEIVRTAARPLARAWVRAALAAAAIALAAGSLASSHAIHRGAAALYRAEHTGPFMAELRRAIGAFEPLAVFPRILLLENVAPNWPVILDHDAGKAFRLLAWAEAEAGRALADEPENWQLQHALAKMYTAVATTHPDYGAKARLYYERALEVAPYQDPLMPAKPAAGSPRRP